MADWEPEALRASTPHWDYWTPSLKDHVTNEVSRYVWIYIYIYIFVLRVSMQMFRSVVYVRIEN